MGYTADQLIEQFSEPVYNAATMLMADHRLTALQATVTLATLLADSYHQLGISEEDAVQITRLFYQLVKNSPTIEMH